jgi:hypothetical protein
MKDRRKTRNPVAKHSRTFNKSKVYKDRKKAVKQGYNKHNKRFNHESNNDNT